MIRIVFDEPVQCHICQRDLQPGELYGEDLARGCFICVHPSEDEIIAFVDQYIQDFEAETDLGHKLFMRDVLRCSIVFEVMSSRHKELWDPPAYREQVGEPFVVIGGVAQGSVHEALQHVLESYELDHDLRADAEAALLRTLEQYG